MHQRGKSENICAAGVLFYNSVHVCVYHVYKLSHLFV